MRRKVALALLISGSLGCSDHVRLISIADGELAAVLAASDYYAAHRCQEGSRADIRLYAVPAPPLCEDGEQFAPYTTYLAVAPCGKPEAARVYRGPRGYLNASPTHLERSADDEPFEVHVNTAPPPLECEPHWRAAGYIIRVWPDRAEIRPQQ